MKSDKEVTDLYESWLAKHGKVYNDLEEKERRFEIFKENLKFINEHNAGNNSYKVGLNQFSDLTKEEFSQMLGFDNRSTETNN
ncbi:Peptidase C1A [Macleaya cordata]|uniref:Peptidase C1A n=1 Tax=Macleaya cordata TaxID=56857 RepID=A0A200QZN5_MACCD|nr:Peptidase C1A [Macleaya cordata]